MGTFGNSSHLPTVGGTSKKIDVLLAIGAGEIIENTINKLISYQLAKYKEYVRGIKGELEKFENMYDMSS